MRNSVIVFLASAIGGLISAWLTAWVDGRYRAPGISFPSDPVESFPAASTLRAGSVALVCAWISVLAVVAWVVLSSILRVRLSILFAVPVGLIAAYLALFIWVALRVRCPKCQRRVLDHFSRPPYPQTFFGLAGSGATVLRVVVQGVFHCIHCGQRFTTGRRVAARLTSRLSGPA